MTDVTKFGRRAASVIGGGLAAPAFAPAAGAATAPWAVAPSANAGTADEQLSAVSALDATHAFAVGRAGGHGCSTAARTLSSVRDTSRPAMAC